ncbi:hypothetical protein ACJJTC_018280 [Scirpophaga incertulas]
MMEVVGDSPALDNHTEPHICTHDSSEEDVLDIDFVCDSNQIALDQLHPSSVTVDRIEVMDESDSSDENSLHIDENDHTEDIKHNMQIDICDNELPGGSGVGRSGDEYKARDTGMNSAEILSNNPTEVATRSKTDKVIKSEPRSEDEESYTPRDSITIKNEPSDPEINADNDTNDVRDTLSQKPPKKSFRIKFEEDVADVPEINLSISIGSECNLPNKYSVTPTSEPCVVSDKNEIENKCDSNISFTNETDSRPSGLENIGETMLKKDEELRNDETAGVGPEDLVMKSAIDKSIAIEAQPKLVKVNTRGPTNDTLENSPSSSADSAVKSTLAESHVSTHGLSSPTHAETLELVNALNSSGTSLLSLLKWEDLPEPSDRSDSPEICAELIPKYSRISNDSNLERDPTRAHCTLDARVACRPVSIRVEKMPLDVMKRYKGFPKPPSERRISPLYCPDVLSEFSSGSDSSYHPESNGSRSTTSQGQDNASEAGAVRGQARQRSSPSPTPTPLPFSLGLGLELGLLLRRARLQCYVTCKYRCFCLSYDVQM